MCIWNIECTGGATWLLLKCVKSKFHRTVCKLQEASVNKSFRGFLAVLFGVAIGLGLAMASEVSAQIIRGDLVGTVLDKTGAVVPVASVDAVNVDTGVKYADRPNVR